MGPILSIIQGAGRTFAMLPTLISVGVGVLAVYGATLIAPTPSGKLFFGAPAGIASYVFIQNKIFAHISTYDNPLMRISVAMVTGGIGDTFAQLALGQDGPVRAAIVGVSLVLGYTIVWDKVSLWLQGMGLCDVCANACSPADYKTAMGACFGYCMPGNAGISEDKMKQLPCGPQIIKYCKAAVALSKKCRQVCMPETCKVDPASCHTLNCGSLPPKPDTSNCWEHSKADCDCYGDGTAYLKHDKGYEYCSVQGGMEFPICKDNEKACGCHHDDTLVGILNDNGAIIACAHPGDPTGKYLPTCNNGTVPTDPQKPITSSPVKLQPPFPPGLAQQDRLAVNTACRSYWGADQASLGRGVQVIVRRVDSAQPDEQWRPDDEEGGVCLVQTMQSDGSIKHEKLPFFGLFSNWPGTSLNPGDDAYTQYNRCYGPTQIPTFRYCSYKMGPDKTPSIRKQGINGV